MLTHFPKAVAGFPVNTSVQVQFQVPLIVNWGRIVCGTTKQGWLSLDAGRLHLRLWSRHGIAFMGDR